MVEFVGAMSESTSQGSRQPSRSALRSGFATGIATLVVSGSAAVAGAYLAHKFGRNARTDGFLAAYGVYLVIVLAAQAFRIVIVPDLTRASADQNLAAEFRSWAVAFLALAVPISVLAGVFAHPLGDVLTGKLPPSASSIAARALVWVVPAGFAQLLAALTASALAARDSYIVAAAGYALGAVANLALFIALASSHGLIALAWGVALNATIALVVPAFALVRLGHVRGARGALAIRARLWKLVQAASVPLALQGLYLIALRGASGLGTGNQTSLTYAYLIASTLVAATASSLSMISSAPLTRRGIDADSAAAHVVHAAWISLALIGAAAGVFALVGGRVVHLFLGSAFSGNVGRDLGHLVVYLAPWMVASVAFSVTYPLLFVLERPRVLVPLSVAALLVDVPLSLGLRAAFHLPGLVIALAITTFGVIVVLMAAVSRRMLLLAVTGLLRTAAIVAVLTAVVFGLPSLALSSIPAAVVGFALYASVLLVVRPPGLAAAWTYVRALHH
jgi:O-antigen/teichoic acid export membrane protein